MSPTRPSGRTSSARGDGLVVRVSRELDAGDEPDGVRLRLHPQYSGDPPREETLGADTCARLRRAVLDAFDVDSISSLRSVGSDRFERRRLLGTAVIEDDAVRFDPDDSLLGAGSTADDAVDTSTLAR